MDGRVKHFTDLDLRIRRVHFGAGFTSGLRKFTKSFDYKVLTLKGEVEQICASRACCSSATVIARYLSSR
jgi:hypothetical protein